MYSCYSLDALVTLNIHVLSEGSLVRFVRDEYYVAYLIVRKSRISFSFK